MKKWLTAELEKLAPMNRKQRLEYIWEYYKIQLIVMVVLIALTVSIIQSRSYMQRELLISGIFINTATTDEGYAFIKEGYLNECGGGNGYRIELTEAVGISLSSDTQPVIDANMLISVNTRIAAGDLDCIICDRTAAQYYGQAGFCIELSDKLSGDPWKLLQTDSGFTAIDLTGSRFEQEFGLSASPSYILFPLSAPDWTRCERFLNYLFS